MRATPTTFACPGCGAALAEGTTRCEQCHIRLSGEIALRLWQVDQQIAALRSQREWLVSALRRDDVLDVAPLASARSGPGDETRRVLLGLGALCLIAALTAATALIWPALGVGGQTTVLLFVTAMLLVGAVRLQHRLPATADAIAAVGVGAATVDLVAARRLIAPDLGGPASHLYWFVGTCLLTAVLAFVAVLARRLYTPTVGAVLASYGAVVALVSPQTLDGVALVGLIGSALSVVVARVASRLPMMGAAAHATALVGGAAFLAVGSGASLLSADGRGAGMWCGLALSLAVAVVPARAVAAAGGVLASIVLLRAELVPLGTWADVTAGVSAAILLTAGAVLSSTSRWARVATYLGAGSVITEIVAQRSLQIDALARAHLVGGAIGLSIVAVMCGVAVALSARDESASAAAVGATCAVAGVVAESFGTSSLQAASDATAVVTAAMFLLGVAALLRLTRARDVAVATSVATAAGILAAVSVDVSIALRVVSTPEAFVVAPAFVAFVLGLLAMRRTPGRSSWVLLPAVLFATAPTLLLALHGDLTRQIVALTVAAAMLVVGAQGRFICPLTTGAVEIVLVVGRVLGPEIEKLPRWLTLAVLGAAFIAVGSTWERRVQAMRKMADRLRPAVAGLR